MLQPPRGTRDFPPEEMRRRREVECRMRDVAERWGYEEVCTPCIEHFELFSKRSGEEIERCMYDFFDKKGRRLVLRPELTLPVIRMYLNSLQRRPSPMKFYYFGPCYRYEEPQRGRYREFWQFGVEVIGAPNEDAEAEVIALSSAILEELKIPAEIRIGNVGVLRWILRKRKDANRILRMMDKGEFEKVKEILDEDEKIMIRLMDERSIDGIRKYVSMDEVDRMERMLRILDLYGVKYTLDLSIARGLDYYTGMVFEIYAEELGSQSQICGGGSYTLRLDDREISSVGFGFGFDRVVELYRGEEKRRNLIAVISTQEGREYAVKVASELRRHFPTYIDLMQRDVGSQLSHASRIGARFSVIVGRKEEESGTITVRDMITKQQFTVTLEEGIRRINDAC